MAGMSKYLDVVDENNQVIGKETREKIHHSGQWHRGVHVLIFNSKGQLTLQIRSSSKDRFPDHYDCSVSEHLEEGEKHEAAAIRGLREELKIAGVGLKRLLRFRMNYGPNDNMISELYECHYDGTTRIDEHETQSLGTFSLDKIEEMLSENEDKFAPWTRGILKWYLKLPSRVEALSTS